MAKRRNLKREKQERNRAYARKFKKRKLRGDGRGDHDRARRYLDGHERHVDSGRRGNRSRDRRGVRTLGGCELARAVSRSGRTPQNR